LGLVRNVFVVWRIGRYRSVLTSVTHLELITDIWAVFLLLGIAWVMGIWVVFGIFWQVGAGVQRTRAEMNER
jgi:hypothetical protein